MTLFLAALSAFWFGILTSISPCPLASNIAAVSYVGGRGGKVVGVVRAGLAYASGRSLAYVLVGVLLMFVAGIVPEVSHALQKYMNILLGPLMVLVGMFMLGMLSFVSMKCAFPAISGRVSENGGMLGAFMLGVLFAMSFCPTSAALFFGSLLPLSIKHQSWVILPASYGVGTGIPVVAFAFLLSFGAERVSRALGLVARFEVCGRSLTGLVFIAAGIYLAMKNIFDVNI